MYKTEITCPISEFPIIDRTLMLQVLWRVQRRIRFGSLKRDFS